MTILKPILERNSEFLNLHIGTSDTSKYTPIDKLLTLKDSERKLTVRVDCLKNGNAVQKVN